MLHLRVADEYVICDSRLNYVAVKLLASKRYLGCIQHTRLPLTMHMLRAAAQLEAQICSLRDPSRRTIPSPLLISVHDSLIIFIIWCRAISHLVRRKPFIHLVNVADADYISK